MTKRKVSAPESPTGLWNVTVDRVVTDVPGGPYVPAQTYQVDDAIAARLGDAVATREPHIDPVDRA